MKKGSSYLLTEAEKEEPFSLPQIVCDIVSYLAFGTLHGKPQVT